MQSVALPTLLLGPDADIQNRGPTFDSRPDHRIAQEMHTPNRNAAATALVPDMTPGLARSGREFVHGREGIGRLLKREGQIAHVEYFDHPGDGGSVLRSELSVDVRHASLAP